MAIRNHFLLLLFLFIVVLFPAKVGADDNLKRSNYIYIFDCTKSMENYGILNETLSFLHQDINERIPGNEITILLFQEKPLESFHFMREDFSNQKWEDIEKSIRNHTQNTTNTNICSAWEKGLQFIDNGKYNYIYLMTDGEDNAHGKNGTSLVCDLIREWCGKYRDSRAYYVELYKGAINGDILKAIQESCNFLPIHSGDHDHFMAFDKQRITFNTRELEKVSRLHSDWSRETSLELMCSDPYFNVSIVGGKLKDGGVADFKVIPKVSLQEFDEAVNHSQEYVFTINLQTGKKNLSIQNPEIEVLIINKPERILTTDITEGCDLGCAHYYPSFLFWKEKELDTLSIDLGVHFNPEAIRVGSTLTMKMISDLENDNYTLIYNGKILPDKSFSISKADQRNLLQIIFDRTAPGGERNFMLQTVGASQLDRVNQGTPTDYALTFEAEYDLDWNPLQTILFWLCAILIGMLLLWICLLKPIARPNFKGIRRITLEDQKDSTYYKTIPTKGYRLVVLTNKREKQSVLSKFFGGKISYEVDDRWTSPVTITPYNNGVHIHSGVKYIVDKHVCKVGDYAVIEGPSNNIQIKLTLN